MKPFVLVLLMALTACAAPKSLIPAPVHSQAPPQSVIGPITLDHAKALGSQ